MATSQNTLVIVLAGVLVAVLAVGGFVWLVLPGDVTGPANQEAVEGFNSSLFERSDYVDLDRRLIQDGSLPVTPPQITGKAIPFL